MCNLSLQIFVRSLWFLWISPSTAKFLATYIINLVLILHGIFTNLLQSSDPPRALSNDVVDNIFKHHNADLTMRAPDDNDFATNPEQVIGRIIRKQLGLPPVEP